MSMRAQRALRSCHASASFAFSSASRTCAMQLCEVGWGDSEVQDWPSV